MGGDRGHGTRGRASILWGRRGGGRLVYFLFLSKKKKTGEERFKTRVRGSGGEKRGCGRNLITGWLGGVGLRNGVKRSWAGEVTYFFQMVLGGGEGLSEGGRNCCGGEGKRKRDFHPNRSAWSINTKTKPSWLWRRKERGGEGVFSGKEGWGEKNNPDRDKNTNLSVKNMSFMKSGKDCKSTIKQGREDTEGRVVVEAGSPRRLCA